jgi:hypothetical protein
LAKELFDGFDASGAYTKVCILQIGIVPGFALLYSTMRRLVIDGVSVQKVPGLRFEGRQL